MSMLCEECGNELGDCTCVDGVLGITHAAKEGSGSYCGKDGPTTEDAMQCNCERCHEAIREEIDKHCVHCDSIVELELMAEDEDGTSQVWAKKCPKCGYIDAWADNDRF